MLLAIAATHSFLVLGSRPLLPPNSRAVPSRHTSLKFQEVELSDDVRAEAAAGFAAWWEDSDDEVDGHMCSHGSPVDPTFYLHHCMVDKIWAVWQDCHEQLKMDPATLTRREYDGRATRWRSDPIGLDDPILDMDAHFDEQSRGFAKGKGSKDYFMCPESATYCTQGQPVTFRMRLNSAA